MWVKGGGFINAKLGLNDQAKKSNRPICGFATQHLFWPYHGIKDLPRRTIDAQKADSDKMHGIWVSGGPSGGGS